MSVKKLQAAKAATPRKSRSLAPTPGDMLDIPQHSFTLDPLAVNSLSFVLGGYGGVGKTTFALKYAPGPIALINFDGRHRTVLAEVRALGKTIYDSQVARTPEKMSTVFAFQDDAPDLDAVQADARRQEIQFMADFDAALDPAGINGDIIRSLVIDTGTELQDLFTVSISGQLEFQKGFGGASQKGLLNKRLARLFTAAQQANVNLIFLTRAKQKWVSNEPVDIWLPDIAARVKDDLGDVTLMLSHDYKMGEPSIKGPGVKKWQLDVLKAGPKIAEIGAKYTSKDKDWQEHGPFAMVAKRQLPDSNWDDWVCPVTRQIIDAESGK